MKYIYLIALLISILTSNVYSTVTYKVKAEWSGTTQSEISMSGETGNWIIELIFDAKVIINVSLN